MGPWKKFLVVNVVFILVLILVISLYVFLTRLCYDSLGAIGGVCPTPAASMAIARPAIRPE